MELSFPVSLASFSLVAFLVYKLFTVFKVQNTNSTKNLPPGPWKLPVIGSLHHLVSSLLPHDALSRLSTRYGPIFHLQLGEISTIVVSSPELVEQVLKNHDLAFGDRPQFLATKVISYNFRDIVFSPHGDYWRQMRKICVLELLSNKAVQSFSSIREHEALRLVEFVRSVSGVPINFSKKISEFASGVTAKAAFGKRCEEEENLLLPLIQEMIRLAGVVDMCDLFPSIKLLQVFSATKPKLLSTHRKVDKILDKIIEDHRELSYSAKRVGGGGEDLVDVLIRYQNRGDLECPITTNHIKAVIVDMFSGGTDTSSTTSQWAMSEIIKNPRVMEKVQVELRKVLKGKSIIRESDIQGLSYFKSVIKETLRLHPPLPLLIPRKCTEQCEIDGYNIPVNTNLVVNAWALGRDPRYWHHAESFIPERFCENSIEFVGTDFQYIPFGAGRRICPGINFGLATVELPLAQLLYHFNWELPDGIKKEHLDMTEAIGATVGRRESLHLIASPFAPSVEG